MELPITVMIVLFVTVIVGAAILAFAKGTLTDAKDNVGNLIPDKQGSIDDKIIEVQTLTEQGVRSLAESCITDAILQSEMNTRTCAVIKVKDHIDLPATLQDITVKGRTFTFTQGDMSGTTVFMTYNAEGTIELTT